MKNFLMVASLLGTAILSQESQAKSVWLARLTGQPQCEKVERPGLGQAISQLEEQGAVIQEAKVGFLGDRAFCASCDCPDGSFHIAKVEATDQVENIIQSGEWEIVDEKSVDSGGRYTIQPVVPQQ